METSDERVLAYTNIIAWYSKMNEHLSCEKYCDVNIKINEKSFKCHRLVLGSASRYFDAMFTGHFKESKSMEDIELKEVEVSTFEDVLKFIYTGEVAITNSNVLDMIRASDFYELRGLEKLCQWYVEKELNSDVLVENALEFLTCFYDINKDAEVITRLCAYIRKHFEYFSNTASFLRIGLKELLLILEQFSSSDNQDLLLHAIIRWVQQPDHSKMERDTFFNELIQTVYFEHFSADYVERVVKEYVRKWVISDESKIEGNNSASTSADELLPTSESSKSIVDSLSPSLFVYVNSSESVTNVFTVEKYGDRTKFYCQVEHYSDAMRCVPVDNRLYYLNYRKLRGSLNPPVQKFGVSTSVSLSSKAHLKIPPLIVSRFDMCGMNNCLYMYNKDTFSSAARSVEDSKFNDEEISRGVYVYNCEINEWMPLPMLKQKLANACMTCDDRNNLLYLIGGTNSMQQGSSGYVQTYDPRAGVWLEIARTYYSYENGASCFVATPSSRIYVSDGLTQRKVVEIYDAVGGQWLFLLPRMNENKESHHLISYKKNMWAFSEKVSESGVEALRKNDTDANWSWSTIPSLSVAVANYKSKFLPDNETANDIVIGSVLFKSRL